MSAGGARRATSRAKSCGQLLVARRDDQRGQPAERRQHARLALADLALEERLAVAGDDRLHHRDARACSVCTKPRPGGERAAGAARHLMQQLERALAGARVGALAEPEIAIDDADGGELREVVALGHHLRADDDVGLARLDAA